jgi:hypothetical protein
MKNRLENPIHREQLRHGVAPGSTLDQALRLHRLFAEEGRRFSRVTTGEDLSAMVRVDIVPFRL